jgi:hypothetical protein
MHKWFILLGALLLLIPSSAAAQGNITLESLQISLWAEHDQPSMLVIYDFKVTDDTNLPATVDIRIPREGNITAVAYNADGQLLLANYQIRQAEDAGWQIVSLNIVERTTYRIEYYQPLQRDGSRRIFTYQWTGEYPIRDFSIEVQVPDDSTGTMTNPAFLFVENQPILSGRAAMRDMDAGEVYQLQLQYSRASEAVVFPASSQVEPSEPIDASTDGRVTLDNLPYILGGIGVILILSALYYSWRVHPFHLSKPRKRQRRAVEGGAQVYCHQCGTRAQAGDRFCRACGSKLRTD